MAEMNGTDPLEADPDVSAPGQEILYGEQTRLALANFRTAACVFRGLWSAHWD
jgi:hypothetical protein